MNSTSHRQYGRYVTAALSAITLAGLTTAPAWALPATTSQSVSTVNSVIDSPITLDQGHVDAFFVQRTDSGIALNLREDVTGQHVIRKPEAVTLVLNDKAKLNIPEGFPAPAGPAWAITQTQKPGVLWTGWSSEELAGSHGQTDIDVEIDGPAPVFLWTSGMDASKPVSLLAGGGFTLPGTIRIPEPAHVHANWVFTKPGTYTVRARAKAQPTDGGAVQTSQQRTYTFSVGLDSQPKPEPSPEPTNTQAPTPEPTVAPEPSTTPTAAPTESPDPSPSITGTTGPQPAPTQTPAPTVEPTPTDTTLPQPTQTPTPSETPAPTDTPQPSVTSEPSAAPTTETTPTPEVSPEPTDAQPSVITSPSTPSATTTPAITPTPPQPVTPAEPLAPAGAAPAGATPAPQVPAAPAPQAPAAVDCKPVLVKADTASIGGRNVRLSGQQVTSGHFDAGPVIQGSKLVSQIKDDRKAPATWRAANALTFALGKASEKSLPRGLEFVGTPGQRVWLIGNVQEHSVPWLGVNTQHPSLASTTGEVTYRLNRVNGPGKVALWSAGAFGSGVGARLADNVGGPRQFTVPPNTHMHPAWAFTQPGNYRLDFSIIAKTKSGQTLTSPLPMYFKVGDASAAAGQLAAAAGHKTYAGKTPDGKDCSLSAAQVAQIKSQGGSVLAGSNLASGTLAQTGADNISQTLTWGAFLMLFGLGTTVFARRVNTRR